MPVISAPHELLESDIYIDLRPVFGRDLYLKCEGFNFGGSVKMRAAVGMVRAAEREGRVGPDTVLVESSSGNLGIALSVVAASKGLRFICVTDARCNEVTVNTMRVLGAEVVVVQEPLADGGLLGARLEVVRRLCAEDPRRLWLNQYANEANWGAHYDLTAPEIAKRFPDLDVLFLGVGTGGTAMGCVRYFNDLSSPTRVVAIDAAGSVTFGRPPRVRHIPGLGSGVRPPLVRPELVDDVVHVEEVDTIRACRTMSARGFLLGGSTGTVLSGALAWLERHDPDRRLKSVAISPDLGERYIDTIYNDAWVLDRFGESALRPLPLHPPPAAGLG